LLINDPEISQLAAVGKFYDPLTPARYGQLIILLERTEKFTDLPKWARDHFQNIRQAKTNELETLSQ